MGKGARNHKGQKGVDPKNRTQEHKEQQYQLKQAREVHGAEIDTSLPPMSKEAQAILALVGILGMGTLMYNRGASSNTPSNTTGRELITPSRNTPETNSFTPVAYVAYHHHIHTGTRIDTLPPTIVSGASSEPIRSSYITQKNNGETCFAKSGIKKLLKKIEFVDDAGVGQRSKNERTELVKNAFKSVIKERPEMADTLNDFLIRSNAEVRIHTAEDSRGGIAMLGRPTEHNGKFVLHLSPAFFERAHQTTPTEHHALLGDVVAHELTHYSTYVKGLGENKEDRYSILSRVVENPAVKEELDDFVKKATGDNWYEDLRLNEGSLMDLCRHASAYIRSPELRMPRVPELNFEQMRWAGRNILDAFKFERYGFNNEVERYDEVIAHANQFGLLETHLPRTAQALASEPFPEIVRITGRAV